MATLNNNNNVKDNWDDSSDSEVESENNRDVNNTISVDTFNELSSNVNDEVDVKEYNDIEEDNDIEEYNTKEQEEWDFYEGFTSCINCGKSNEVRIIMIESKRVFCYNVCLNNGNDGYDDDDYDDYDELDDYDRKLGLSVSCR